MYPRLLILAVPSHVIAVKLVQPENALLPNDINEPVLKITTVIVVAMILVVVVVVDCENDGNDDIIVMVMMIVIMIIIYLVHRQ